VNNITYIILLKNQEKNIQSLADSFKSLHGDFRKEYIIVDDFSSDNTRAVAMEAFSNFPKTTIISNNNFYGPSYSINQALKVATGKYIHFIDGDEVLAPDSTALLMQACDAMGTSIALGLCGTLGDDGNKFSNPYDTGDISLVESPVKAILENIIPDIRRVGYSSTLIARGLLEQIGGANESIFLSNMSLGLSCGKYSKIAFVKKTLCYSRDVVLHRYEKPFEAYNDLSAIVDFIENHRAVAENYTSELYKALWSILWHLGKKYKVQTLPKYFLSRYMKRNLDCDTLIDLYCGYIESLEW
jgi:glycosyltransferase involved in cell wall biosynthesis